MISKGSVSGAKFTTVDKRLRIRDVRELKCNASYTTSCKPPSFLLPVNRLKPPDNISISSISSVTPWMRHKLNTKMNMLPLF